MLSNRSKKSFRERFRHSTFLAEYLMLFILWFPLDYYVMNEQENWKESVISSLIYSAVVSIGNRFVYNPMVPLYFRRSNFDHMREAILEKGWQLKKEKNGVQIFRRPGSFYLFSRKIKLHLSPFYACVEVPERYREVFLEKIEELKAKLHYKTG